MKKKSLLRLITIAVLTLAVMLAMFPGKTLAEDGDDSGLSVVKEVNVQDDGTYIVDLEAYANGTVSFGAKPVDLILVLDVSGSMDQELNSYKFTERRSQGYTYNGYGSSQYYYKHTDGNYYRVYRDDHGGGWWWETTTYELHYTVGSTTYYLSGTGTTTTRPTNVTNGDSTIWTGVLYTRQQTGSQTKLAALQTAVNGFVDVVADKNQEIKDKKPDAEAKDLSRVSIVKFAMAQRPTTSNQSSYEQYQQHLGDDSYTFSQPGYTTVENANYTQVVKDLTVVDKTDLTSGTINWHGTVNGLHAAGATAADYGMGYAQAIYDAHHNDFQDRETVVVMFTDGAPTHGSSFNADVANDTITAAGALKKAGVKIYSVAVLEGANPALDPTASGTSEANKYLHGVSSNYPNATKYTNLGTRYTTEDGKTPDYYFAAESAEDLEGIFTAIAESSASSQVGAEAVMKDIVSNSFTLPKGATAENIIVSIVPWNSTTHNWSETDSYTAAEWKTKCRDYGAAEDAEEDVQVTISADGKTVDITGFDYSTHFLGTKVADKDHDGVNAQAAKLVVSFPIQAKPSAITGSSVATNGEASGIYANADAEEAIVYFPVPEVTFKPVTYVVDYVTSDTTTDTKASTIKLEYDNVLGNVERLDDPSDDVLIGKTIDEFEKTIYKGKYGTVSFGENESEINRRYVRYAPTTMNWDGYDRIFVKGQSATDSKLDVWAMLCVLPANSVFYEDTYITQTKTATYNGQTVEIEYTGIAYTGDWSTVGIEGNNQTQHAGDEMGWISGLADDDTYANEMAHTSSTAKAKASFTVTGTGIDIYSRTNGSTGTILVTVKSAADKNADGKKITKSKVIDTKAASGDYYAVPVCTFTDLPYGEYTTTITVSPAAQNEGRMTFYLDGVRVYNPIKPLEGEENVQDMYGEKNLGAVFTEVRSMLGTGAESAALYLDEKTKTTTVTDVEKIQAAAKELAQAQQNRDAYVEGTITPAKKAYEEAVAAGEEQARIKELEEALKEAIEGKAPYDEAVDAKIKAYDDANKGTEVGYTEKDIAEYKKEGPKSEVYLDKGQEVAIKVEEGKYYYIGLKSLTGDTVTAQINGQNVELKHTVDLYYEAIPDSDNYITISNTGNAILSITKLRTTGAGNTTSGTKLTSSEEMLSYIRSLEKEDKEVTSYDGDILTQEEAEAVIAEEAETDEVEEEVLLDENDIVIENADVDSETEVEEETETTETAPSEWSRFLSSFFGFFRH